MNTPDHQAEEHPPAYTENLWAAIDGLVTWLDLANGHGEQETALRLLKLAEEVGEVGQAYIGATGQNPRKGTTHTRADVADELCDVIVAAMVALHRFTPDPPAHFAAKVQRIAARVGLRCVCDDFGDGSCPIHLNPDHPMPEVTA